MKKDKEIKLYEEPVIKVVKFQVEHGFAASPEMGGGENPSEDDGDYVSPHSGGITADNFGQRDCQRDWRPSF